MPYLPKLRLLHLQLGQGDPASACGFFDLIPVALKGAAKHNTAKPIGGDRMTGKAYPVPGAWRSSAYIDEEKYRRLYDKSIADPNGFWREEASRIDWIKPFTKVKNTSFAPNNVSIKWFEDGTLNVCANCVDRHLPKRADQVAILWEGDEPDMDQRVTYRQLHERVCRLANVLKKHGVKKGDRVTIYLPMIPEAAFAMLACARIGAIHSVVFG